MHNTLSHRSKTEVPGGNAVIGAIVAVAMSTLETGAWETHTKGIGSKLMQRMGYKIVCMLVCVCVVCIHVLYACGYVCVCVCVRVCVCVCVYVYACVCASVWYFHVYVCLCRALALAKTAVA